MGVWVENVVVDVAGPEVAAPVADLYAALLGFRRISRGDHYHAAGWPATPDDDVDPLVVPEDGGRPTMAFELPQPPGYVRPSWPDPGRPAQVHMDIAAPDLDAAIDLVRRHGGDVLAPGTARCVAADAGGHPLCLVAVPGASTGRIDRIVLDGDDVDALARFWHGLVDDDDGPELAFQRTTSAPPAWPDPTRPQQLHLDLGADDVDRARARAVELGGRRLPHQGGGAVYADPFGHPFCLGE